LDLKSFLSSKNESDEKKFSLSLFENSNYFNSKSKFQYIDEKKIHKLLNVSIEKLADECCITKTNPILQSLQALRTQNIPQKIPSSIFSRPAIPSYF